MISLVSSGRLQLREASSGELAEWDNLVRRFANYRIAHTTAWLRSLEASGFGRPHFLVLEQNGEIVGCLPGLVTEVGPLRLFGSPPPASQTASMGPAFDEQRVATPEMMDAVIPYLEGRLGIHHMEIMSPDLDPAAMLTLGFRGESWPTYRVRLFPGDEPRSLKGLKDSARRNVARGKKLGLEVRFEHDESFVDEHYAQIKEVYVRGGHAINFGRRRVLECFRRTRDAGSLIAVSVYLPDGRTSVATGMFTIEGTELLLWTWAHRAQFRWHRPTELMTWTVMQRAIAAGCVSFDLMGLGDFKMKFGAERDDRKYRWVRSRYRWLGHMRDLAARGLHWQQALRGKLFRKVAAMSSLRSWIPLWWMAAGISLLACGGGSDGSLLEPQVAPGPQVILAAGNIATCGSTNDEATATLLDNLEGTVFTLGDNALSGSAEEYGGCYEPSWGRHKNRTYAVMGNHEYAGGTATPSFDYFGDRAGPRDLGYYSMDLGNWHIIVLNIHDYSVGEQLPFEGSAQDRWLQADLAASSKTCTLAMWHAPRFFSSNTPDYTSSAYVTAVWNRLYAAGVDVVLNGHQHHYERFPPMTPNGTRDDSRGIRQFNAGTGGESVEMPVAFAQHSAVISDAFGVLKLTLDNGHYTWEFVPVVPGQFSDSGSGTCH